MIPFMGGKKDRIWEKQGVHLQRSFKIPTLSIIPIHTLIEKSIDLNNFFNLIQ